MYTILRLLVIYCLLDDRALLEMYNECGTPSAMTPYAQMLTHYITSKTHIRTNRAPQVAHTDCSHLKCSFVSASPAPSLSYCPLPRATCSP